MLATPYATITITLGILVLVAHSPVAACAGPQSVADADSTEQSATTTPYATSKFSCTQIFR